MLRILYLCSHKSLNILLQVFAKYVNVHDLIKSDDRESQKTQLGNFSAEKLSLRFHKSHKSKEVCFLKQKKHLIGVFLFYDLWPYRDREYAYRTLQVQYTFSTFLNY